MGPQTSIGETATPRPAAQAALGAEESLLRAARRGDEVAFVRLLRLHERRLRVLAFRVLRDQDLLEDALQEVALRAFRGLRRFRGDSSLHTWLSRITYTTSVDLLRARGRQESLTLRESPAAGDAPDPADVLAVRAALSAALDSLSAEHRAVVLLVLQEGLDHATVAEILGIPPGTVASRLHTSRRRLCEALEREGSDRE